MDFVRLGGKMGGGPEYSFGVTGIRDPDTADPRLYNYPPTTT